MTWDNFKETAMKVDCEQSLLNFSKYYFIHNLLQSIMKKQVCQTCEKNSECFYMFL